MTSCLVLYLLIIVTNIKILSPSSFLILNDSMPRVILLANKPFTEQFTCNNTVYIINRTINLKGDTLVIPANSILYFNRGKVKNGSIVFNNTELSGKVAIDCNVSGRIRNEEININWFLKGAKKSNKLNDSSQMFQSIIDLGANRLIIGKGYYKFHHIKLPNNIVLNGKETIIIPDTIMQEKYDFNFLKNVFYGENIDEIIITGICFKGHAKETILPSFKSDSIYGEPLIWINGGNLVTIEGCKFMDIENCTYCNAAYKEYDKKQGSLVCCWDVSKVYYCNNEQVNCRHDEQVWIIGVNKPIMDLSVYFNGNYIHDMKPGPNSSAFTCVAGFCDLENNEVERYEYPGSLFNTFAKKLLIKNNTIHDCYCSSVFDACEYRYYHNDEIELINNNVEAINSVMLLSQSQKVTIKNNVFKGLSLFCSANYRIQNINKYPYWYTIDNEVLPTDSETLIEGNSADFTYYDGNRSIAGTKVDYGTGEIVLAEKTSNVGDNYGCGILIHPIESKTGSVIINNNKFTSFQSLEGITDKNNLINFYPHTIRMINVEKAIIQNNEFNGAYRTYKDPDCYTCISIYNYPDVMQNFTNPMPFSTNPTKYKSFTIQNNIFNVSVSSFAVVALHARVNSYKSDTLLIDELNIAYNTFPKSVSKVVSILSGPVFIKDVNAII